MFLVCQPEEVLKNKFGSLPKVAADARGILALSVLPGLVEVSTVIVFPLPDFFLLSLFFFACADFFPLLNLVFALPFSPRRLVDLF